MSSVSLKAVFKGEKGLEENVPFFLGRHGI